MRNSVNDNIIDNFCDSIWIEKGLSRNTIESYASDLNQLSKWLSSKDKTIKACTEIDINMFLAEKIKKGNLATSINRYLSSIKSFFNPFMANHKPYKTSPCSSWIIRIPAHK